MKIVYKGLIAAAALLAASNANAATTIEGSLNNNGVADYFFSFSGGAYSIAVNKLAPNALMDPEIFLFQDDGSPVTGLTGALIGNDDDSGGNLNSLLSGTLTAGNYVLSIGTFNFTQTEARRGRANFSDGETHFSATFSNGITLHQGPVSPVPEPATWGMMILGFGLVGYSLRRGLLRSNIKFDAKIKRIAAGLDA